MFDLKLLITTTFVTSILLYYQKLNCEQSIITNYSIIENDNMEKNKNNVNKFEN